MSEIEFFHPDKQIGLSKKELRRIKSAFSSGVKCAMEYVNEMEGMRFDDFRRKRYNEFLKSMK